MVQIKKFDINKMGRKPGMCLQNVRLGFGIGKKFYDAKADMLNNRSKGTLHPMNELTPDMQVPVYVDSASEHEHIIAYDRGIFYSDGKKLTSTKGIKFFGWGELCEDVRVIDLTAKYRQGQEVEIDVPIKRTGSTRKSNIPQGGLDVQVDDGNDQFWIHESLIRPNNHIVARVKICYVGGNSYIVQAFDQQFWVNAKNIKKGF